MTYIRREEEVKDQPIWIEDGLTGEDIWAIQYGGCASGAYMPAVVYADANDTMFKHGDEVLDYIQDVMGELPTPPQDTSWTGMACFFLSCAVELWASGFEVEENER